MLLDNNLAVIVFFHEGKNGKKALVFNKVGGL